MKGRKRSFLMCRAIEKCGPWIIDNGGSRPVVLWAHVHAEARYRRTSRLHVCGVEQGRRPGGSSRPARTGSPLVHGFHILELGDMPPSVRNGHQGRGGIELDHTISLDELNADLHIPFMEIDELFGPQLY